MRRQPAWAKGGATEYVCRPQGSLSPSPGADDSGKTYATTLVGKYSEEYAKEEGKWKFLRIEARQILAPVVKVERQQPSRQQ